MYLRTSLTVHSSGSGRLRGEPTKSAELIQRLSEPFLPALTRRPREDISDIPVHDGPCVGWLDHPRCRFILLRRPFWDSLSIMNSLTSFDDTARPLIRSKNGW